MIALYAFGELCDIVNESNCQVYRDLATSYAEYWTDFATTTSAPPHSKLAYDLSGNTWSTKYNLVWQKLLRLDGPFKEFDQLAANEAAFYRTKVNAYGFPMDLRHTYQKTDWMTWGSLLSPNKTQFVSFFHHIFRMVNETKTRIPFTDLYDTVTAEAVIHRKTHDGFTSRPVVGALFAGLWVYGK